MRRFLGMRLVPFRKNYGPVTSAGVVPGKFCSDEQALGTGSLQVVEKFCGKCTKIKYNVVVFIEATAAVHHGCAPYLPLQFFFKKVRTCPKWTELVVVQYRFDVNNTFRMCFGTLTWRTSVNVRADLNHQISQKEKRGKIYLTRLLGNGRDQALHFSCNGIEPEYVDSW